MKRSPDRVWRPTPIEDDSVTLVSIANETIERLEKRLKILTAREKRGCSTEGCFGVYYSKGLCKKCYGRGWVRRKLKIKPGDYRGHFFIRRRCKTFGCGGEHLAKGYCQKCYSKYVVNYPDWTRDARPGEKRCSLCERLHYAKDYCKRHYEISRHKEGEDKRFNNLNKGGRDDARTTSSSASR